MGQRNGKEMEKKCSDQDTACCAVFQCKIQYTNPLFVFLRRSLPVKKWLPECEET